MKNNINIQIFYPAAGVVCGLLVFLAVPLLDYVTGYTPKEVDNPYLNNKAFITCWYPFRTDQSLVFVVINIMQLLTGSSVVLIDIAAAVTFITFASSISSELVILKLSLRDIQGRAARLYELKYGKKHTKILEDGFEKCLYSCLKDNIIHYHKILKMYHTCERVPSSTLFLFFTSSALLLSTSSIGVLNIDSRIGVQVKSVFLCFAEVMVLAFICWAGEELRSESESIRDVLYDLEWINTSKRFTTALNIMQMATRKPITIQGAGLLATDYNTLSTIINSTFSYFNLLLASRK